MAKLTLVTGPTVRLVSPADLHAHCRIDDTAEDAYLAQLSDAAQEAAEGLTWRKFLKQTWDQYLDRFADPLRLRYPPLHSDGVTGVTYTDTDGDTQTLATSVYEAAEEDGITTVRRKYDQVWPSTRSHKDVVKVTFVCGWNEVDDVPERILHAIRLHASHYFRNRDGQPLPEAFYRLLDSYRVNKYQPIGAA